MFGASSTTTPGAAGVASVASAPKGFYFKPRRMRLDWLKIGSLNLQRVIDDCDISVLQNNLEHLTFADVTPEDLGYFRDHTNVLKVFRLCQLTMEYLLEVQGELVRAYSDKEAELRQAKLEAKSLQQNVAEKEEERRALNREVRYARRVVRAYERSLAHGGAVGGQQRAGGAPGMGASMMGGRMSRMQAHDMSMGDAAAAAAAMSGMPGNETFNASMMQSRVGGGLHAQQHTQQWLENFGERLEMKLRASVREQANQEMATRLSQLEGQLKNFMATNVVGMVVSEMERTVRPMAAAGRRGGPVLGALRDDSGGAPSLPYSNAEANNLPLLLQKLDNVSAKQTHYYQELRLEIERQGSSVMRSVSQMAPLMMAGAVNRGGGGGGGSDSAFQSQMLQSLMTMMSEQRRHDHPPPEISTSPAAYRERMNRPGSAPHRPRRSVNRPRMSADDLDLDMGSSRARRGLFDDATGGDYTRGGSTSGQYGAPSSSYQRKYDMHADDPTQPAPAYVQTPADRLHTQNARTQDVLLRNWEKTHQLYPDMKTVKSRVRHRLREVEDQTAQLEQKVQEFTPQQLNVLERQLHNDAHVTKAVQDQLEYISHHEYRPVNDFELDRRVKDVEATVTERRDAIERSHRQHDDRQRGGSQYDDRRGGSQYDDRRGGSQYDDRRGGSQYDDRRGGSQYDDRRGGSQYDDRQRDSGYGRDQGRHNSRSNTYDQRDSRGNQNWDNRRNDRDNKNNWSNTRYTDEQTKMATKIQARYRGRLQRKRFKEQYGSRRKWSHLGGDNQYSSRSRSGTTTQRKQWGSNKPSSSSGKPARVGGGYSTQPSSSYAQPVRRNQGYGTSSSAASAGGSTRSQPRRVGGYGPHEEDIIDEDDVFGRSTRGSSSQHRSRSRSPQPRSQSPPPRGYGTGSASSGHQRGGNPWGGDSNRGGYDSRSSGYSSRNDPPRGSSSSGGSGNRGGSSAASAFGGGGASGGGSSLMASLVQTITEEPLEGGN